MDQLEELLGPPQILEPMGAEVHQVGVVWELVGHQGGRGAGQQHLTPMTDRHDPRATDHRRTEVVVPSQLRLAGVQPHPHPQGSGLGPGLLHQPALASQAGAHRLGCGPEDGHQAIAGGLDHLSAGIRHRSEQDRVVALQRTLHRLRKALPQASAALDVGEQEGEGARRVVRKHGDPFDRPRAEAASIKSGHGSGARAGEPDSGSEIASGTPSSPYFRRRLKTAA